ncbi:quercetin dioxygenase-like cupin family protein/DNA-binding XRE family transcriptional regulator [Rhizobium petrolearium]|uniref:helix-turn-helix domain-containing protein n=1 Tax=Neorhizobium petrolearium TaxID=515361 RepID=UPI001AE9D894|nr:cupin domain-containing protein [Neorhizobium petrolearium]MBP1841779.1 quercetin dioxygenase-like cupin family protein/DNA-binding XRE family transcriptional regulator [Neorhizobium petrolearium]
MLSETLTTALEGYAIGPKIRRLRLRKKLGLVQLGEHTGLSAAMLSKIERGHLFPTLPTLLRIALVFGVGLDHFFKEDSDRPVHAVVRKADRIRLPDKAGRTSPAYRFESLDYPVSDRRLNGYYVEFGEQDEQSEPHEHAGAEIIYVLRGELVVNLEGEDITLNEGDSMYFECTYPHSYRRNGSLPCAAIVVVTAQPSST